MKTLNKTNLRAALKEAAKYKDTLGRPYVASIAVNIETGEFRHCVSPRDQPPTWRGMYEFLGTLFPELGESNAIDLFTKEKQENERIQGL